MVSLVRKSFVLNKVKHKISTPADVINILPLLMTHCSSSSFSKADGSKTCKTLKLYKKKRQSISMMINDDEHD